MTIAGVLAAHGLGHQHLEMLAAQRLGGAAEQPLDPAVGTDDMATLVERDDAAPGVQRCMHL